jgi:[protein-PII] uridylyltransferase
MDKSQFPPAPYFDPQELRETLSALFHAHGTAAEARPAVVERLKLLVKAARGTARLQLEADGNGRRCATGLARFQDELVRLLYDYTVWHVYRATNPSDAERMAVVATGGYGRELLAPGSDIDLLFLLPYKQTPWGESVAEYMLYLLWDLGFKVGHATRTVDQCLKLARDDTTIRTSLLDMWLIHGDANLYAELERRFRNEVIRGSERAFIDAKMAERSERHRRAGESRYRVEPNIKDGKGGLRDLHTLHWLSKYLLGHEVGPETVAKGIFTKEEAATFRKCENFLWTVRCFLHFYTGRSEELVSFEVQPMLAEKLGYRDKGGLRAVERFMKHYFLIAKDVGDLTTILCSALEIQQMKSSPVLESMLSPISWMTRRQIREKTDFRIDNGRMNIADPDVFKRDPVNLIRFFAQAENTNTFLHPNAIRQLRHSHRLIDDTLRNDPEANRIFMQLLTGRVNPEATLRRMNECGVLGRFIPEFGHVVAMMQFNMYHHYTVDEHLIRTVGMLTDIERGGSASDLPLSTELIKTIQNRRVLFVAAFLHDIGKGRLEDHSLVGAEIARKLCPRLGLSQAETDTVVWLIEQHLTMSNIAQSRDINDPRTVRDFADIVQSPERLKLLLLLSVADIRAVGPGVWNGWKGQLLRTLYAETERQARRRGAGRVARRAFRLAAGRRRPLHRPPLSGLLAAHRAQAASLSRPPAAARGERGQDLRRRPCHGCLHGHHGAHGVRAQPPAAALALRGRLRRQRRQHRRRAHHDDARRLRARHVPARTRVRGGRGRVAPGAAHRGDHRAAAPRRHLGRGAARQPPAGTAARGGLHGGAGGLRQQRAVGRLHRDRGRGPRPHGASLRTDQRALGPVARHRVGARDDLRREGG